MIIAPIILSTYPFFIKKLKHLLVFILLHPIKEGDGGGRVVYSFTLLHSYILARSKPMKNLLWHIMVAKYEIRTLSKPPTKYFNWQVDLRTRKTYNFMITGFLPELDVGSWLIDTSRFAVRILDHNLWKYGFYASPNLESHTTSWTHNSQCLLVHHCWAL